MTTTRNTFLLIVFLLTGASVFAQQSEFEAEEAMRAAEEQVSVYEVQMREAEERLAEAARKIAVLSSNNLPTIVDFERRIHMGGRAVLGINIGSDGGEAEKDLMVKWDAWCAHISMGRSSLSSALYTTPMPPPPNFSRIL